MAEFIDMPKLTEAMSEGKILSWMVEPGASVNEGDAIAEVETDKAAMEIESTESGVLLHQIAVVDDVVPIGNPIAIVGKKEEDVSALLAYTQQNEVKKQPRLFSQVKKQTKQETIESAMPNKIIASPAAARYAAENGVDLASIQGSGPHGRIIKRDIAEAMSGAAPAAPQSDYGDAAYQDIPLSSFRLTIANTLTQSLGPIPHFFVDMEVDAGPLCESKDLLQQKWAGVKLTLSDFIIKACASALNSHPTLNSHFINQTVRQFNQANIGLAAASEKGVVIPVLVGCESKSLKEIALSRIEMMKKAKNNRLTPTDMKNGTFTISNLGMFGVKKFNAVIFPPQTCILAVGAVRDEAVVNNGAIEAGKRMALSLSADHRAIDGAAGAAFLSELKRLLEKPGLITR